jgi:hypothetical protein
MYYIGYIHGLITRLFFCNSPPVEMIAQYLLIKGGNLW